MVARAPILHRYRGNALIPSRVGGWLNSLRNDRSGPHRCSRDGVRAGPPPIIWALITWLRSILEPLQVSQQGKPTEA